MSIYRDEEKQSKIYRTEILHISVCRGKESIVTYTERKYYRCQYGETRKGK